ncbi:ParB N-terminal domain-containing protein [Levilactobacillus enshiensis]|uniref:ParB N-terminal domain-containing protein n=1 Tax=Levilactobacillus enshiensis TaxID=2590213 RepID=UPI00117A0392|nr:ParB/RepB/Spo0J family partition protein [Levilactobacillus enshiensis]
MTNDDFNLFSAKDVIRPNRGYKIGEVFKTDDYSLFKLSKFNRTVILRKAMIEQAKEGLIAPIVVNENFVVIDGQHRLAASKVAKVPVEYIVKPGLGKNDIVRMNTIQRKWSLEDYVDAFANQGNPTYVQLAALINQKYADITTTVEVAVNLLSPSGAREKIENGKFAFFNYGKTVEFLHFYESFRKKTKTPKRSTVTTALYTLFKIEKFDKDRMAKKVIATGLNEDIKIKTFNHSDILKELIDSYNARFSPKNSKYINYHIASTGAIVIDEEMSDWAIQE